MNRYLYAKNRPVVMTDPSGRRTMRGGAEMNCVWVPPKSATYWAHIHLPVLPNISITRTPAEEGYWCCPCSWAEHERYKCIVRPGTPAEDGTSRAPRGTCGPALRMVETYNVRCGAKPRPGRPCYVTFKGTSIRSGRSKERDVKGTIEVEVHPCLGVGCAPTRPPYFTCGPDITDKLLDVLARVMSGWGSTQYYEESVWTLACQILFPGAIASDQPIPTWPLGIYYAFRAWDIYDLHNYWESIGHWYKRFYGCNRGPACEGTVMVSSHGRNSCHYAWAVNYSVYGVLGVLCGVSLKAVLAHVWAFKRFMAAMHLPGYKKEDVYPAQAWAQWGWVGAKVGGKWNQTPIPGTGSQPQCRTCYQDYLSQLEAELRGPWGKIGFD